MYERNGLSYMVYNADTTSYTNGIFQVVFSHDFYIKVNNAHTLTYAPSPNTKRAHIFPPTLAGPWYSNKSFLQLAVHNKRIKGHPKKFLREMKR